MSRNKNWRVVRHKNVIYIVSPNGVVAPEPRGFVAAERIVARLNATKEVEDLVSEGKL